MIQILDSAYAGPSMVICEHLFEPFEMEANEVQFPASAYWESVEGEIEISDFSDPNATVEFLGEIIEPLSTIENYAIWTVDNGACGVFSDTVALFLEDCLTIEMPDAFSPNGDLINDLFVIPNLENYPNNSVVIMNRWGDEVYSASPYLNDWDGKSQNALYGEELPVGTYYIILDLGDDTEAHKGFVYLKR